MAHHALGVANDFIRLARADGDTLSNMKLHKLMYFAQGHALGLYGEALVDEQPQAWQYGPVFPSVYHEFKHFGSGVITDYACDPLDGNPWPGVDTARDEALLAAVWNGYKGYSALRLSQMSHVADGPWSKAFRERKNATIREGEMRRYFGFEEPAAALA